MRVFATGATRDHDVTKLDFDGFLSPLVIERFAEYMHKHRQTPKGLRDSDNWQKGIPLEVYRKSAWRHHFEFWKLAREFAARPVEESMQDDALCDALEEALCALQFNQQGFLHGLIKARDAAATAAPAAASKPAPRRHRR